MIKKRFSFLIITLLLLALSVAGCSNNSKNLVPNVNYTTLEGTQITDQSLRGKVVLIVFWATDCTTCIAQMPGKIERHKELSPKGFETIAIAMKHDPESYVRKYAESRQLPFPVVLDTDGSLAKAFGDVKMTPTAFLVDKKGNIIKRYLGNYDESAFVTTVNKALAS